jgi:cell division protease FtsH
VVREILDTAYARTKRLLTENIDKLHVMAGALLEYETIDARQIDDIMQGRRPGPPADWDKPDIAPTPPPKSGSGSPAKVGDPAPQP